LPFPENVLKKTVSPDWIPEPVAAPVVLAVTGLCVVDVDLTVVVIAIVVTGIAVVLSPQSASRPQAPQLF